MTMKKVDIINLRDGLDKVLIKGQIFKLIIAKEW